VTKHRTQTGGRIDRTKRIRFSFDGKFYEGTQGDTLASALLANGVHLTGRSFKYHRPRGILAAGSEEPNALVAVRRDAARYTPNLRATQIEIFEGLQAESQNRWPNLKFDMGRINDLLSRFFPAGFYYKTFMWPRSAWKSLYEPVIRRAAGIGKSPTLPDPDRYSQRFAHCEVMVVGSGPAGVAAALSASQTGSRVILCDEQPEFGGSLLSETAATINGLPAQEWLAKSLDTLSRNPNATLLKRTTAFGYFPHNLIGLNERLTDHLADPPTDAFRERLWQVRAATVILATGAIERPLVFAGNDRPGIMLAGAARTYLNRYGVRAGSRAVLVTANDAAYQSAIELAAAGVAIPAIVDVRSQPEGEWHAAAKRAGIDIFTSATVLGTRGNLRVSGVQLGQVDATGAVRPTRKIDCDLIMMSGGYTPSVHLFSQSRGALIWDETLNSFVPGAPAEAVRCVGACRGVYSLAAVLDDGAGAAGSIAPHVVTAVETRADGWLGALPRPVDSFGGKAFVDWQHDVTVKDISLATREGFQSIEHIKRFTTTGMATDQGKTSNLNALAIASDRLHKPIPEIGLTTFRMPYTPITFGSFAGLSRGDLFDPVRKTPIHGWAAERGAVFEDVGLWKRARYFPAPGDPAAHP